MPSPFTIRNPPPQMSTFQIHLTPNPNSFKITTKHGAFIDEGMLSFARAEEATGHPLGAALFAIEGVANVFLLPQFLTVTIQPGADSDAILSAVVSVLERYFQTRN